MIDTFVSQTTRPTRDQVHAAAIEWCGEKDRETGLDDVRYFEANWSAFPGFRARVEKEVARNAE